MLEFAWYINSCKRLRILIGTWLGGGGGWEWTPLDIRIIYGHFFKSSGINLEYLTPQEFWIIDPCLIILPVQWGCAIKK